MTQVNARDRVRERELHSIRDGRHMRVSRLSGQNMVQILAKAIDGTVLITSGKSRNYIVYNPIINIYHRPSTIYELFDSMNEILK